VDDLPDAAFVVRYGETMRRDDLALASLKHSLRHSGVFAISVHTIPGLDPDAIAQAGRRPNKRYCHTTVGELRRAGFIVDPNVRDDGHTNVILPSPPTPDHLERLVACFWGKGVNPLPVAPERRRKP
jgi:hypothetical protein